MKYVYFEDMHNDGTGGLAEVTDEEFGRLEPHRRDMENCNPLPPELGTLLWETVYSRCDDDNDDSGIPYKDCLTQRIC